MDLEGDMPWPRRRLRKLGEALTAGHDVPDDCPSYNDVMLWHHDVAAEVASVLSRKSVWASFPIATPLRPSARSKTHDTLVQKLIREAHLTLDQVQDLAGVRVDVDCSLDEQLALAQEIAQCFGTDRARVKDIRANPHSGYRGVHVWLKLPAGRAEIQIRTLAQSAWANTYERLGDLAGRQIRYGAAAEGTDARIEAAKPIIDYMQTTSSTIAKAEELEQKLRDLETQVAQYLPEHADRLAEQIETMKRQKSEVAQLKATYIERLHTLKNQLDEIGG